MVLDSGKKALGSLLDLNLKLIFEFEQEKYSNPF